MPVTVEVVELVLIWKVVTILVVTAVVAHSLISLETQFTYHLAVVELLAVTINQITVKLVSLWLAVVDLVEHLVITAAECKLEY
jgi:hypothetical protein